MDFFYDSQVKNYLLQFIRIFSDIKVQSGEDENGVSVQKRVPVRYADISKMVAHIIADGNQNAILPAPMMTVWIQDLSLAPERRNDPAFVGKVHHTEREWDNEAQSYTSKHGQKYTIERYMPVPYTMTLNLDIWTTNTTDKLQLIEQITMIFNPSLQIQQNANLLDWSSIFEVELTDVAFTNRSLPMGTEYERDIATLTFKVPIWINPPAKVKVQKLVENIVNNVYDGIDDDDLGNYKPFDQRPVQESCVLTPRNHKIGIGVDSAPNEIMLLNKYAGKDDNLSWETLIQAYGEIQPTSTITLKLDKDLDSTDGDIVGVFELTDNPTIVTWTVDPDTLPSNTLDAIHDIVSPKVEEPGKQLPNAKKGQRYLIVSDEITGTDEPAIDNQGEWNVTAYENDIIEYDGSQWHVVFDHRKAEEDTIEYVTCISNTIQYRFENGEWNFTYLGKYNSGYWRINL